MKNYRLDTHVHTSESSFCSEVPGAEIAKLYKEAGYSGIVITDHFHSFFFDHFSLDSWTDKISRYLAGYRAALYEGEQLGLTVLLGMEIRFPESNNDYLVFGMDEAFLLANPNLHEVGLKRFRHITQGKNIRIYQAHPFRDKMERVNPELLDGVEVLNGHPRHNSRNHLAREYAKENSLRIIAGSDAHLPGDVGISGLLSPRPIDSSSELIALLDNGDGFELIMD